MAPGSSTWRRNSGSRPMRWTRTAVRNDQELAQIAQQSEGVISKKTIVTNHPWVDDAEQEMEEIEALSDALV